MYIIHICGLTQTDEFLINDLLKIKIIKCIGNTAQVQRQINKVLDDKKSNTNKIIIFSSNYENSMVDISYRRKHFIGDKFIEEQGNVKSADIIKRYYLGNPNKRYITYYKVSGYINVNIDELERILRGLLDM